MEFKCHKTMLYMGGNLLYLVGWILSLIGLGLIQDECKDMLEDNQPLSVGLGSVPFFTEPVGEDCKKGIRCVPEHSHNLTLSSSAQALRDNGTCMYICTHATAR